MSLHLIVIPLLPPQIPHTYLSRRSSNFVACVEMIGLPVVVVVVVVVVVGCEYDII